MKLESFILFGLCFLLLFSCKENTPSSSNQMDEVGYEVEKEGEKQNLKNKKENTPSVVKLEPSTKAKKLANAVSHEDWGIPFKWKDLPKDLCEWISNDLIKKSLDVAKVESCKITSFKDNPFGKMVNINFEAYNKRYHLSLYFANADKLDYSGNVADLALNSGQIEAEEMIYNRVKCFATSNHKRIFINKQNKIHMDVSLIEQEYREMPAEFGPKLKILADELLKKIAKL